MPTIIKHIRPVWLPKREAHGRRLTDNSAFYNSPAWRACAKAHKAAFPLCVNHATCRGATHTTDHIVPIAQGGALFDWDNLQSLCSRCNASKTGKDNNRRGGGKHPTGG